MKTGLSFEIDTKAVSDGGEFEGYASVFGTPDLMREVIVPGAFAKSLQRRPAARVKMLAQHDMREPIGVWTDLTEDSHGLKAKGRLILDTVKGRETHALLKQGAIDGLSVGFKTVADHFDRAKQLRYLDELDLWEISVVTLGAHPDAVVTAIKSNTSAMASGAFLQAVKNLNERLANK